MSKPWLSGADEGRVRSRADLHQALTAYTSGDLGSLFDRDALDALYGAHSLTLESFLQVHGGQHVSRWASGKGKDGKGKLGPRRACSQATVGMLHRLEHFRQQNSQYIRAPRGLVP